MPKNELTTKVMSQLPAHLQQDVDLGVDDLSQFIIPPRVKIVQKQSSDDILEHFGAGDVIIVPQQELVAAKEQRLIVVPIFFYPEWVTINPLQLKGQLNMIRQRTLDPKDPLVEKCRDPERWEEECPEDPKYNVRHTEMLNFVCVVEGHEGLGYTPIVFSFSRAEHRTGSTFASKIKMRHGPICGCRFVLSTSQRSNTQGQWYGFDISNPGEEEGGPWVSDPQMYELFKQLHEDYKTAHNDRLIQVDYEDEVETTEESDF